MIPKIKSVYHKSTPDLTNGMLYCVRSAETEFNYHCIIQRLN